jgi:hypothetical protein
MPQAVSSRNKVANIETFMKSLSASTVVDLNECVPANEEQTAALNAEKIARFDKAVRGGIITDRGERLYIGGVSIHPNAESRLCDGVKLAGVVPTAWKIRTDRDTREVVDKDKHKVRADGTADLPKSDVESGEKALKGSFRAIAKILMAIVPAGNGVKMADQHGDGLKAVADATAGNTSGIG